MNEKLRPESIIDDKLSISKKISVAYLYILECMLVLMQQGYLDHKTLSKYNCYCLDIEWLMQHLGGNQRKHSKS